MQAAPSAPDPSPTPSTPEPSRTSRTRSALFYLCTRSLLNNLMQRVRRLKQPRYLLGAVFALAYLYFIFVMPYLARAAREAERIAAGESVPVVRDLSEFITTAAGLSLLVLFAVMWLWRRARTALQLSEAEITWLFPGPVTHAAIVHFSLIRTQAALLLSALLITLFTAGWRFIPSPLWARAFGWWLLIGIAVLHVTASGFTCTRLRERGFAQWQRQLGVLALLTGGLWLMNVVDPHLRLPVAADFIEPGAVMAYVLDQTGSGPLYWLLAPLRAVAGPLVAADAGEFLRALGPALFVYALHYYWAFRSERPDVEATMENAAKRANMLAAMRKNAFRTSFTPLKTRPDPFPLPARGSPLIALLWKNLLSTRAYLHPRSFVIIACVLVVWNLWLGTPEQIGPFARIPTIVALFIGVQTLFIGAQFARQDLRSDLENADLIKIWPLPGWQVVLGELLAPACILSGILWLCLLQITLAAPVPESRAAASPELRWIISGSLALLLPLLCATQVLIANAVAVLFPAWARSANQGHGWETIVPRLLFLFGALLASAIVVLPALLGGTVVYIPASWFVGNDFALLPAAIVAA
ncbi:MAG: putative ABC exporter domain-containing protein, partial [Pseudomonadota bacterium]|nr:putative ABC exporter domain-containing protein [Pseudomonadota bacterium]